VVDADGKLVGILGRLDVLNTIAAVHLPEWHPEARSAGAQATVGDVMTRDVPTMQESATVEEIFELLVSSSHKRRFCCNPQSARICSEIEPHKGGGSDESSIRQAMRGAL
jgi:CBS domain-containing protein